jgi:hypothetical protein
VDAPFRLRATAHASAALADFARHHGTAVILRDPWPGAARLLDILDLEGVRVEFPA